MGTTITTRKCSVPGCSERIPNAKLMCGVHWKMVPPPVQKEVWTAYYSGDFEQKCEAAQTAVAAVLEIEKGEDG